MSNRTVTAAQLKEGSVILVTGKLAFSRLAQIIDGDALTAKIARETAQKRLYPTRRPHTTATLLDAQVMMAVPGSPTPEETYVQESLYVSKADDTAGKICYSIDSLGNSLPPVLERQESGSYKQVVLERDLATGLDVTLVLNVYKPSDFDNRGLGIAQVLVNEPIEYYAGGATASTLAARGIVVEGGIQIVSASNAAANSAVPAGTVMENGLAVPGPAAAPVAQPVAAAPVAQPVAVAAPVAQPAPIAAPVAQAVETEAQKNARLQAELDALRAAQAGAQGTSPFDAAPAAAGAGASPWESPQGITYQG